MVWRLTYSSIGAHPFEYVEIKSSRKFQSEMVQSIVTLKKRNEKAVLLYQGKSLTHFNDIDIQNYADYLME
jgi:hypothetical protein